MIKLKDMESAVQKTITDHTTDSSPLRLKDMKAVYKDVTKGKAEDDGLVQAIIDYGVSDRTAKIAMVAVAMGDTNLSFTTKMFDKN